MIVNDELIENMILVSKEAGREILKFFKNEVLQLKNFKIDSTPVTQADLSASQIIEKSLFKLYPTIPLLSEESEAIKFKNRLKWTTYFLVDPLDGTKEFIKDSDEFTVNIALIVNGESVAGVIYQPVNDTCYYGTPDKSYIENRGERSVLPIAPYEYGALRIVSSKSHKNIETELYIKNLSSQFKVESTVYGSSLKICKVAEGVADLNPRLGGTSEWDIAAGHAIIRGAGGDILDMESGQRVLYNKESLSNPHYEVRRKEVLELNLKRI